MRAACSFCWKVFKDRPEIYVTPCGHAFHAHCLHMSARTINYCDRCKTRVDTKDLLVLKLFFEVVPNIEVVVDRDPALVKKIETLEAKLKRKTIILNKNELELGWIEVDLENQNSKVRKLTEAKDKYNKEILNLNERLNSVNEVEEKIKKLERKNRVLRKNLQLYQNVDFVLSHKTDCVQSQLEGCGTGPQTLKRLATYSSVLNHSIQQIKKAMEEKESEMVAVQKKFSVKTKRCDKMEQEFKNVRKQLSLLKVENKKCRKKIIDGGFDANIPEHYESPVTPADSKTDEKDLDMTPVSVPSNESI